MVRTIIAVIFVVLYCVVSIPLLGIMCIVRLFNKNAATWAMLKIVQWALGVVYKIGGVSVTTIGLEDVPDNEPVLFVANHQSFFDVIIGYTQMKTRCGYVAKKSFEKVPVLSWNMKFLYCLFIDRANIKQGMATINKAIDYIKNGISVFIFPEGTRNKSGDETKVAPFHRGSFHIAKKTGCRIIPVSFNNTEAIFERQFPKVKPTHVVIEYGKPVAYKDLTRDEQRNIDEYFRTKIRDMVIKNRALE